MEKSQSIKSIAQALITFHVKADKIKKDATNSYLGNKYASLSNIQESIHDALTETGLCYSQFPTGENGLTTILIHAESGEYMQDTYTMKPTKADPQGIGSAITYQRRYALAAILGLNIDDDDDGNEASKPDYKNQNRQQQPQQPPNNNSAGSDKPWLNEGTKEYTGAIVKLKSGETTIEKIKQFYKIGKAVETKLLEASKK